MPTNLHPSWVALWDSPKGLKSIANLINTVLIQIAQRTYYSCKPEVPEPFTPSTLALRLIAYDRRLTQFIPPTARAVKGGVLNAEDVVALMDLTGKQYTVSDTVFTIMCFAASGVTQIKYTYTGGSDNCDLENVTFTWADPAPKDGIKAKQALVETYNIDADLLFDLCGDSGAGSGGGYTNEFIVTLFPKFNCSIVEISSWEEEEEEEEGGRVRIIGFDAVGKPIYEEISTKG